jgi:hypothetical protein
MDQVMRFGWVCPFTVAPMYKKPPTVEKAAAM